MMEETSRFRSAMMGFHRQDVLDYLSRREEEMKAELDELRDELEIQKRGREEAEARVAVLDVMVQDLEERSKTMEEDLVEATSGLTVTKNSYEAATAELTTLRKSVADMGEKALAYERIKDKTAAIELDAHSRAGKIVADAKDEMADIREEGLSWVREIMGQYQTLRTSLETSFEKAAGEMASVSQMFSHITEEFTAKDSSLVKIMEKMEKLDELDDVDEEKLFAD